MSLLIGIVLGAALVLGLGLKWFIGWYFNDGSDG